MKKIAVLFLFFGGCCVQHAIVNTSGLKIDVGSRTSLDSMYILRNIVGEQEFGYYSNCPGNDSLIWKNVTNKEALKKMNVTLERQYLRDDIVPASKMKYMVQDTSIASIDTILPSRDTLLPDQAFIRFRIKKDGKTILTGKNSEYELKTDIIVKDNKLLPTGFPQPQIKHYSSCKCKS